MRSIPNEPIGATQQWYDVVNAARLRCECQGQCGAKHKVDRLDDFPKRCKHSLVQGDGRTPRPNAQLKVKEVMPGRFAAVCDPCFAGLNLVDKRAAKQVATSAPPQEESLF